MNDIVPPLPPAIRDGYNWYGGSSEDFVEGGCRAYRHSRTQARRSRHRRVAT